MHKKEKKVGKGGMFRGGKGKGRKERQTTWQVSVNEWDGRLSCR